jgi:hypothetical protein
MGLFDKLFGNKSVGANNNAPIAQSTAPVPMKIDMSKHAENLNTVLIDMSKNGKTNMSNHTARVAVVMDYSGSMSNMFRNGSVQDVITRLLPIALKFDDNGELESWLFSEGYERLEPVTASNYERYVKNIMMNASMYMGGTNYAPALKDIVRYYKDKHPSTIPAFVMFITDGDNWDETATNAIIRELSNYNMFVQFVGIGNGSDFNYLRELDNLSGRKHDNTGFIAVRDMNKMNDQQLYTEMLRQYNDWLNNK